MNGDIIGFRPQTQQLESPYKTPSSTLAVKGLRVIQEYFERSYSDKMMDKNLLKVNDHERTSKKTS